MAKTNSLDVRHQLAVKTEAQWKAADPVLLLGEIAISSDKNNQFKVGTGSAKWSALSYSQMGPTGAKGATGVGFRLMGAWKASTAYVNNTSYIDVVTYGGSTYACKTSHTSGTAWASTNWVLLASKGDKGDTGAKGEKGATGDKGTSLRLQGAWKASTAYVKDANYIDVVTYGGSTYACTASHTSGSSWDSSKWTLLSQKGNTGDKGATGVSMRLKGAWVASTVYVNNASYIDFVVYGGSLYACKTSHTSASSWASANWTLVASKGDKGDKGDKGVSMRLKGAWAASTAYVNDTNYIDIVTYGGSTYACKTSHTSASAWNATNWTLLASKGDKGNTGATGAKGVSMRLKGAWTASTAYVNDTNYIDAVTYGGSLYLCKTSHTSASAWAATNWTLVASKGDTGAKGATGVSMRLKGAWTASTAYVNNSSYIDFVTNGGNLYACKASHTSGTAWDATNWTLVASKGDKGDKGATGEKGATGAKGVSMRLKGAWAASTAYVNDANYIDVVTYGGSTYACKTSHTSASAWAATNWTMISQKGNTGATGAKGVSMRLKGAWAASTAYVNDANYIDAVTYGGSLYLCKTSHTSGSSWASTNWTLAASKGDKGATGEKGATGGTGPQGPTGAKGVSVRLKGAWAASTAYVNDTNYIDIVTHGGSTYACKTSHTSASAWADTNWTLLASKGDKGATGAKGVSMRVLGDWEVAYDYVNDTGYIDVVTYDGSTYACTTSHTSGASFDSTKWVLLAKKGATGATGAKGDKGATGPGYNSISGTLTVAASVWEIDDETKGTYHARLASGTVPGCTTETNMMLAVKNDYNDKAIAKAYSKITQCNSAQGMIELIAVGQPEVDIQINYIGWNRS